MTEQKSNFTSLRKCKKCSITKIESEFYIYKKIPLRFSSYCKKCEISRSKNYVNSEKRNEILAKRRENNKTKLAKSLRADYLKKPEVAKRNRILAIEAYKRRKQNPSYVICQRISVVIRRSIKTGKNNRSWRDFVDYSIDELKDHLERQFTKGMSWENIGKWHIDHIVPLSSFSFKSPTDPEFKRAWALSNLRPLWAAENLTKKAARIFLI